MATVSGVWVWNQFISGDDFNQDVSFTETTLWGNMKGDNTSDGYELRYGATGGTNYVLAYSDEAGGWQRSNLVIDFGSSEQTVTDTFYTFLTANATQQAAPSVPTPDWANCFVKDGSTVTCEQCGGSGTYYWTETGILSEPCTSCGGSGMMGAEMCGACGGSGSMAVETVIEHNDPCPNCQATGFISTSENKAVEKVWIKQNNQLVNVYGN